MRTRTLPPAGSLRASAQPPEVDDDDDDDDDDDNALPGDGGGDPTKATAIVDLGVPPPPPLFGAAGGTAGPDLGEEAPTTKMRRSGVARRPSRGQCRISSSSSDSSLFFFFFFFFRFLASSPPPLFLRFLLLTTNSPSPVCAAALRPIVGIRCLILPGPIARGLPSGLLRQAPWMAWLLPIGAVASFSSMPSLATGSGKWRVFRDGEPTVAKDVVEAAVGYHGISPPLVRRFVEALFQPR